MIPACLSPPSPFSFATTSPLKTATMDIIGRADGHTELGPQVDDLRPIGRDGEPDRPLEDYARRLANRRIARLGSTSSTRAGASRAMTAPPANSISAIPCAGSTSLPRPRHRPGARRGRPSVWRTVWSPWRGQWPASGPGCGGPVLHDGDGMRATRIAPRSSPRYADASRTGGDANRHRPPTATANVLVPHQRDFNVQVPAACQAVPRPVGLRETPTGAAVSI